MTVTYEYIDIIENLYKIGRDIAKNLWYNWKREIGITDPSWGILIQKDNIKQLTEIKIFYKLFAIHFTRLFLKEIGMWRENMNDLTILNYQMPSNFIFPFSLRLLYGVCVEIEDDGHSVNIQLEQIWREMIRGTVWERKIEYINPSYSAQQFKEFVKLVSGDNIDGYMKMKIQHITTMPIKVSCN